MKWDRFDICEAYYLVFVDCHVGQGSKDYARLCRLTRPGFFKPAPNLSVETLSENGREIYDRVRERRFRERRFVRAMLDS